MSLSAYELINEKEIDDIHAHGIVYRHKKTGANICVLSNEDENKVFYIGFRTPVKDSTGVPHIVEHTVLCGSRKFPLKDPFIELVKGSLNTFLNAMTYPDKTVYPVASCNDKDFQNLMDVYLDSVFYPNLHSNVNIFRQEGWHYELENKEDDLIINGIVYNEMKGAFSSADGLLEREILNSLYPDTNYSFESGGDPDNIPDLTYEAYCDFHKQYYHPSNSYIYLYGNMNIEEKLDWIDTEYLSHFEHLEIDSSIPDQTPFTKIREIRKAYSISSTEKEQDKTYLSANWAMETNLDPNLYVAFSLLDYALLSSQGAPIKQALLDAGIGNDIYGGYDNGVKQPYFSIVAKNTEEEKKEQFLSVIQSVLRNQVETGIDKATLLAGLNTMEFRFREADFGRYPKGLMLGLQMLDSWLYDDNQPFLHLEELGVFAFLREQIHTDYFEQLIQKYFLNNTHQSVVVIYPQKGLHEQKEAELAKKLSGLKASLSDQELDQIIQETKDLRLFGETPSTPEQLDTIPLLERSDMKQVSDTYSNIESEAGRAKLVWHDYDTSGIIYQDYLFDVHHVVEEDVPYLSILSALMGRLDTEDYSFKELSDEIHLYTGGINTETNAYANFRQVDDYYPKLELHFKTLPLNYKKAMKLAESILLRTKFDDEKRILEVLEEIKSRTQAAISASGHSVSAMRGMSYYKPRSRYLDLISGIGFFRKLCEIVTHFEENKIVLIKKLKSLTERIFTQNNLLVSVTTSKEQLEAIKPDIAAFADKLDNREKEDSVTVGVTPTKNEGFTDASQIQYVSLVGIYDQNRTPYHGSMRIFNTIMNYEYLWGNIRVKGGAYGCSANSGRFGDIFFTSYRDPKLSESLEVYRKTAEYLRNFDVDERGMTKFIIGTFSSMDAPLNSYAKGLRSMLSYISGLTYDMIQKERDEVLCATVSDIRKMAVPVAEMLEHASVCVIGNEKNIADNKEVFDYITPLVSEG